MALVANGDVSAIKDLYSHTPDATSFYGWGGYEKGWEAVSLRWDWAGAQFKGGSVRHENISTIITPEFRSTSDQRSAQISPRRRPVHAAVMKIAASWSLIRCHSRFVSGEKVELA